MEIRYQYLSHDHLPEIHQTFIEAFSDYSVDVSYMTLDVISKRAVKNGIDYELSVGAFDNNIMVGFTLVGIDRFKGKMSAFDIATGIIKQYRGKGIAGEMFDFALQKIRKRDIQKFWLEVIRDNEMAVKAYQKTGFEIVRELDCYFLDLQEFDISEKLPDHYNFRTLSKDFLSDYNTFMDWEPSWENSISGMNRIQDRLLIYGIFDQEYPLGIIVYYPLLNWILGLGVKQQYRRKGIGSHLVKYLTDQISGEIKNVKFMNIDASDVGFANFLKKLGFKTLAGQYEMKCDIAK